ncbi:hypothetical protein ACWCPI_08085 [Streptomyces sp. NPDC001920]
MAITGSVRGVFSPLRKVGIPVDPAEGADKVTFGNASAWAPSIGRIELGRVIG